MQPPASPYESVDYVGRRRNDVLLNPVIAFAVDVGDATLLSGLREAVEGPFGCLHVPVIARLPVSTDQHGDSLALRQARIPGCFERGAVFPVEMVVPDPDSGLVLFEVGH